MNIQRSPDQRELLRAAREAAYSTPLADFHPGAPQLFRNDTLWPYFERLRKEEPVHYCTKSPIEPYWSVTKYNDIMHVDTNHGIFSSDVSLGGISIRDVPSGYDWPSFIAMDQPRHSAQRKTVSPMFTPKHLDELAILIRGRTGKVLDSLPRNETFNFVDLVSIELTTQMLATLFDFPFEERRKLTRWSDVSTALPKGGIVDSEEQRRAEMDECAPTGVPPFSASQVQVRALARVSRVFWRIRSSVAGRGTAPPNCSSKRITPISISTTARSSSGPAWRMVRLLSCLVPATAAARAAGRAASTVIG